MLKLEPRPQASKLWTYGSPLLALAVTVLIGVALFIALGKDPVRGLQVFFWEPIKTQYAIGELMVKATPLLLIALGLAVCFRSNVWNIGAEGQYIIGALCAAGVGIAAAGTGGGLVMLGMILAGIVGGTAWASVPAVLRTRFSVNEILSSLMLTYVALQVLGYLVNGPWKDPNGRNFPATAPLQPGQSLPILFPGTTIHLGVAIAVVLPFLFWLLMSRSVFGFQIRVVGSAPHAARHGGFDSNQTIWMAMLISGATAGLAGALEFAGALKVINLGFPSGYGFTAIIVSFLGRLHPIGCLIASIVLAVTYVGGQLAKTTVHIPDSTAGIFQAMMLFFILASDILVRYRVRLVPSNKPAMVAGE